MLNDYKIHLFDRSPDAKSFQAGDAIFQKGDEAHQMFVVIEGEVEIELMDTMTEVVSKGEFFGEMALITGEPRSANVRAKTDCRVVPVDEKRFFFMVQETPNFALLMMRILVERLRRRNQRVADMLRAAGDPN